MNTFSRIALAALWLAAAGFGSLQAQETKVGDLVIDHPWSRATPKGAKVGAGYLVIKNAGSSPDRLVGGSTAAAGKVEIHEMAMKDNVATMRPIAGGLPIEPGKSVTFAPGGYHLMFVDLKSPLKQGDKLKATLEFEKAGKVDVTFEVQAVGAQSPMSDHPGHKM
jgi:periplasmic copper chaperone A